MSPEIQGNSTPATLSTPLPILASRRALALFVTSIAVTLSLYLWLFAMRAAGPNPLLTPVFGYLFTHYDFFGAIALGLIAVLAVFFNERLPAVAILRWFGDRPLPVAAITTLAMLVGTWVIYHHYPLSMDEYAPYFQSKVFAALELTGKMPVEHVDWFIPPNDQMLFFYVSHQSGEAISFYWPSFALLLTPFMWLGIPWALNPILSGLTILVIHRLAMRIFASSEAAGLAMLLTLASPVFFANGISFYSMTAHMLANGLFVLLILDPTPRRLIAAGLVGSVALTLHNPMPHVLFALPWLLWLVFQRDFFKRCACLATGYLPLCIGLGFGWYLLGKAVLVPMPGVPSPADVPITEYFHLPTDQLVFIRAIGLSKVWLWAAPMLVVLAVVGAWRWRQDNRVALLAGSALLTALGYFFLYVEQGHGWGYRYFHSAWIALPLLAAATFAARPAQPADDWSGDTHARVYVVACALLSLTFGIALRAWQMEGFIGSHLSQTPQRPGAPDTPRVEIYDPSQNFYITDLVQNDPFLRDPVIRVITHGPQINEQFMHAFRPGYVRTQANIFGEVWEPPAR